MFETNFICKSVSVNLLMFSKSVVLSVKLHHIAYTYVHRVWICGLDKRRIIHNYSNAMTNINRVFTVKPKAFVRLSKTV